MTSLSSHPDAAPDPVALARRLAIMERVTLAVSEALELPDLLDRALDAVLGLAGVDGGGIFLWDEQLGDLRLAVHRGVGKRLVDAVAADPGPRLRAVASDPNAITIVREIRPDAERREVVEEGVRAWAAIPLHVRGQGLGVLVTVSHTRAAFAEADMDLLATIGRQIGGAIERARLVERERRRARQLEAVSAAAQKLGTILSEQELVPEIVALVCERLGYDGARLFLYEDARQALVLAATSGPDGERYLGKALPQDPERSITGWSFAHDTPLLVNDATKDPRYLSAGEGEHAELAVPIRSGGRPIGVLNVISRQLHTFDESDISALQTFAGQLAVVIENVRLLEDTRRSLRTTRGFGQLATAVSSSLDLRSILDRAMDAAMEVFAADRAAVSLMGDAEALVDVPGRHGGPAMYFAASRNLSQRYMDGIHDMYAREGLKEYPHVLRVTYVEDAQADAPLPQVVELARAEGFHTLVYLPLRLGDRYLGTLNLYHDRVRRYSEDEIALGQTFADQTAVAIEHARLFQDTRRALRRMQAFQEVSTSLTSSLDLRTTLEVALEAAMEVFAADRAAIYFVDPHTRRLRAAAARHLSEEYLEAIEAHYRVQPPLRDGQERSIYIEDAQARPLVPELQEAIRREGFRSSLVLPLRHAGDFLGTFVLYHDRIRRYQQREIALAQTFADQAAIAIQHARLYEGERRAREQTAAILDATRVVTGSLRLEDVLRRTSACLAAALGQRYCGIWLLDDERQTLTPAGGYAETLDRTLRDAFSGLPPVSVHEVPRLVSLLRERRPVLIEDGEGLGTPERTLQRLLGFRTYVDIPLAAGERVVGIAAVPMLDPDSRVEPDDLEVAMAIARSAALAIENARLYEQSQKLAVTEERNRLARELHDSVTHSLFSMTLILQALPRLLERDRARAIERIERLGELSRGALAEMRALIFQLRPAALEEEGLITALTKYAAAFESREAVKVELSIDGDGRLPAPVEEALFRVAQEALNNVAKHAQASRVRLRLAISPEHAELTVADDGRGFDPAAPRPADTRSLGMTSMRERAALLGGVCTVESSPGKGTSVRVRVPLPRRA